MTSKYHLLITTGIAMFLCQSLISGQEVQPVNLDQEFPTGGSTLYYDGITLDFGLRIQGRFVFDDGTDNQDMMLRRTRIKAMGDIYEFGNYFLELRADNINQDQADADVQLEAGFIDLTISEEHFLMIGLYDVPFSRGLLTGDSRLLFMDRGIIINELAGLGLVDNTVGVMAHGRPAGGKYEYAIGISDNRAFDADASFGSTGSNQLMPAGRLVANLLDPAPVDGYGDYRASYIGEGERLALGTNIASLGGATNGAGSIDIFAIGFDLFGNLGPWTYQGEFDTVRKNQTTGTGSDSRTSGWYLQTGYVLPFEVPFAGSNLKLEPTLRYQKLEPDSEVANDRSTWTSVGMNAYLKGHNLKLQMDFTMKDEQGPELANNTFMVQVQFDF